jgi:hypothetical protein
MAEDIPAHLKPEYRRGMAVKMIRKKLIDWGTNPEDATTEAESIRGYLFASDDPRTPLVVRKLGGGLGEFYPPSFSDPVGDLAAALFASLRDDQKLAATQKREEQVAEIMEEKRQSGQYL